MDYGTFNGHEIGAPLRENQSSSKSRRARARERIPLLSGIAEDDTEREEKASVGYLERETNRQQQGCKTITDGETAKPPVRKTGMLRSISTQDFQKRPSAVETKVDNVKIQPRLLQGLSKEWGGETEKQLDKTERIKDMEIKRLLGRSLNELDAWSYYDIPPSRHRSSRLSSSRNDTPGLITQDMLHKMGSDAMRIRLRYISAIDGGQFTRNAELGRQKGTTLYHRRRLSNIFKMQSRENLAALDVPEEKAVMEIQPLVVPHMDFGKVIALDDNYSLNADGGHAKKHRKCCVIQ